VKPTLVVMLKQPRPGRVKTRLGQDIGMIGAAWWFRHQVSRLLRTLRDPRWTLVLAVSPDHEGLQSRVWPADLHRIPQGLGNLGDRMARALSLPGPVCVIGADIPGIRRHHISHAFGMLGSHEAVFGPAPDGGYWLIGLRHNPPAGLFDGVRWSTAHALGDTVATLPGRRIAYVETLRDVDSLHDLAMTAPQGHDSHSV
jgi:rSAM/selenodomain-associated transferase 1